MKSAYQDGILCFVDVQLLDKEEEMHLSVSSLRGRPRSRKYGERRKVKEAVKVYPYVIAKNGVSRKGAKTPLKLVFFLKRRGRCRVPTPYVLVEFFPRLASFA